MLAMPIISAVPLIFPLIIVAAIVLIFILRKLNLNTNTRIRGGGPGKVQRVIFAVTGLVAFGLVIWCTVRDYNNLYQYEKESLKVTMPTKKVKKLEHTDEVESFRVLAQFFAVEEDSGRLLMFQEKILSNNNNFMEVEDNAGKFKVEGQILINEVSWSGPRGHVNLNISSRNSHASGGYGFYHSGSYTEEKNGHPMHTSYSRGRDTFFSMMNNKRSDIKFYTMTSRLAPDDKLKKVDFEEVKPWLKERNDRRYYRNSRQATPFFVLTDEAGPALFILLLGVLLITRACNRPSIAFPILTALAVMLIISLKRYEFSIHDKAAMNKELTIHQRKSAAENCRLSAFYQKSGEKIQKKVNEQTKISN